MQQDNQNNQDTQYSTHPKVELRLFSYENEETGNTFQLPAYATSLSSGFDLKAYTEEPILIKPGQRVLVRTGLHFNIPVGYEIQIRSRSGLALKDGIVVLNSPATIDADFKFELGVILMNFSTNDFTVLPKMRIAQAVLCPVVQANLKLCKLHELGTTNRNGGFGSTGLF